MSEASEARIACPNCGKRYRWKQALAGRKVACKCGQKMRLPESAGGQAEAVGPAPNPNDASTYDLDFEETAAKSGAGSPSSLAAVHGVEPGGGSAPANKCPSCNQPLKPDAILCVKCGYNLQSGTRLQTDVAVASSDEEDDDGGEVAVAETPADAALANAARSAGHVMRERHDAADDGVFIDRYLPLAMFAVGVVGCLLLGMWGSASLLEGLASGGILLGVQLFVMTPLLLLAVCLAAFATGINFGYLGTGILKLAAICVGPGVLGDIVMMFLLPFIGMGGVFVTIFGAGMVYLVFLGIPMSIMFRLDFHETAITVGVAIAVRIFSFLMILTALFAMLM